MTFDDAGILTNEMIAQQDGSFNRVAVVKIALMSLPPCLWRK